MEVVGPGELSHFGPHTVTNHQHTGLTNAPLTPLLFQVREDDDNDTLPSSVELDDERKLFVPLFAPTVGLAPPGRRSSAALSVVDPVGQRPAPPQRLSSTLAGLLLTLPLAPAAPTAIELISPLSTVPQMPPNLRRHTVATPQPASSILLRQENTASSQRLSLEATRRHTNVGPHHKRNTYPGVEPQALVSIDQGSRVRNSINITRKIRRRQQEYDDDRVLVGNKVSEGHQNFIMAYNMLTGIRVAVLLCLGVKKKLTDDDFTYTNKLAFNLSGNGNTPGTRYDFKFKDYAPEVFRDLRSLFGLDPADYLVLVTGQYILSELGLPGKLGLFFYYLRDYRFIIKTIHHLEHRQLLHILKDYHAHVQNNPNTLVLQFYGLHRVKMPWRNGMKKVHFVVMNNLFPPHRTIHRKYDLKGLTMGRVTRVNPSEKLALLAESDVTLKDLNWLEDKALIKFGPIKRKLFFDQLDKDVAFLEKINVMDYLLLLGVHDVSRGNDDELKLLMFDPKSLDRYELLQTSPRDIDRTDLPDQVYPGRLRFIFYGHDGGIRATNEENRPLQEIYYLGIIDCLTRYGFKKRVETLFRSMVHPRPTILAVPAKEYGERFLKFIKIGTSK